MNRRGAEAQRGRKVAGFRTRVATGGYAHRVCSPSTPPAVRLGLVPRSKLANRLMPGSITGVPLDGAGYFSRIIDVVGVMLQHLCIMRCRFALMLSKRTE